MYSFAEYLNRMIRSTVLYLLLLFIILNVGLFSINSAYKQELILQKEDAFVQILKHLYEENGLDYIIEYIEHYGHIHNTFNVVKYDDEVIFETGLENSKFREYMITDSISVMIDSSQSTNTTLTNLLFYVSNVSLMIVFIVGIYLFYYLSKRKTLILLNDIRVLKSSLESETEGHSFSFKEFEETYSEFQRVNKELRNLSLIKLDKLKGVNHDLNTSLTVIKSYLEGYKSGRLELNDTEVDELLEEVEFNSRLVQSLLGQDTISQTVDLSRLLEEILNKYRSIFLTKNIVLNIDTIEDVNVMCNRDDIKRIIQNILSNAYYYSDFDTEVSVKLVNDDGILIMIEDEGIGLTEEEVQKVFESEYRSEDAKVRNKSGKGIGLFTSRELMREQNGDIHILRKDKGLIVVIKFPS